MIEGILFDCDGVLVDSERLYFPIMQEAFLKVCNFKLTEKEFIRCYIKEHTHSQGVIDRNGLALDLSDFRKQRQSIADRIFEEQLECVAGVHDMLSSLKGRYKLGVVSSSQRSDLQAKFSKFDLLSFFDTIVSAADVKHRKPHPEPYLLGAKRLGLPPSQIVALDDNDSGMRSAYDAGCKVIGFPNGYSRDATCAYAHLLIHSLSDVSPAVIELAGMTRVRYPIGLKDSSDSF